MDSFVDDTEAQRPAACSKDLRKYFYLIAVVAALVLAGAYWYTGFYTRGMGMIGGRPAAVNMAQVPAVGAVTTPAASPGGVPMANLPRPPLAPSNGAPFFPGMATTPGIVEPPPLAMPAAPSGGNFSVIAMALRNSVVNVTVTRAGGGAATSPALPTARAEGDVQFATPLVAGTMENVGSGVIVRSDGYVLTNFHVVRGAGQAQVTVFDDAGTQRYTADVVRMDESTDLALLRFTPKAPLPVAVLGDSNRVRLAEEVISIGSPFGLDQTVSRGIVSGMRKALVIEGVTHADLIQTDAAINQGNSGGPLVSLEGYVIGINTAIYTPTGAFSGVGFAIPSNKARTFVETEIALPATGGGPVLGQTVAMQGGGSAPPIVAGTPPPHLDGREKMPCTSCHQVVGAATVAFGGTTDSLGRLVAAPGAAPPIAAGVPAPHADGREKMPCTDCHQVTGAAPVAFGGTPGSLGRLVAAPGAQGSGPPIAAGVPSPHTDGRENLPCSTCHQILMGAGGAATLPVAAPPYQYVTPSANLAVNVATGVAGPAAVANSVGGGMLQGALVHAITPTLGQRLNHGVGDGVFVASVITGSAAAQAQLAPGDILVKIDGRRVVSPAQATATLAPFKPGDVVRLDVDREGRRQKLKLVVGAAPAPGTAMMSTPGTAMMSTPGTAMMSTPGTAMMPTPAQGAAVAPAPRAVFVPPSR
ncbi:MAG: magnetochrome domain-containing protein, partial [Alphaproteobacteria bacterium]